MRISLAAAAALLLLAPAWTAAAPPHHASRKPGTRWVVDMSEIQAMMAVTGDPRRDAAHPARNRQLLIDSRGAKMNALFLLASGAGRHPTMLLLHGLPGNERNLDLAQVVRRAGWNVLTFTY